MTLEAFQDMIDFEIGFQEVRGTDHNGDIKTFSDRCKKFYEAVKKKDVSLSYFCINTAKLIYL